jgi:GDSL-like Lipase/Acylhydrolase family
MKKLANLSGQLSIAFLLFACSNTNPSAETRITNLQLNQSAHIAIIGNTLADRMQEDSWLETFIHYRYPDRQLSFRNLGFSADEVNLRQREDAFGSPDEWLTHVKADVILAFFGFNESFRGAEGLEKFKQEMTDFVVRTKAQKYNGVSTPQLVLFSPIANEDLKSPHLPDGSENNARIELYTKAIADVAAEQGVSFVNIYTVTKNLYANNTGEPLTINGIHLNKKGNELLADAIDKELFGETAERNKQKVAALRESVNDKDFHWFNRYRTTDGYNVYGGRSWLKWGDQTNRDVMLIEMEMFDVMTANRDKMIWQVAAMQTEFLEGTTDMPRVN